MIRINKDGINHIASHWADEVKTFLTEELKGRKQVRYKKADGTIHCFEKRLAKYKTIYEDKTSSIGGISGVAKNKLWERIESCLCDEDFLKGSEESCKKWVRWQKLYLRNNELKDVVRDIFISLYDEISSSIAYDIFERLNIRTCPYCNRHYTFTLKAESGQFKTRPEFDHFYDKSTFPFLAITFFNLVPSCKECNHGKRNNACGVNPYFGGFESKFILKKPDAENDEDSESRAMNINDIFKISKESDFVVDFKKPEDNDTSNAEMNNIQTLGLTPLYNMHKDYVMEIVEKASAYNELARFGIIDRFQGIFHSEMEVYNLIFGKYLSVANHSMRPLSKLTSDILDQLEMNP